MSQEEGLAGLTLAGNQKAGGELGKRHADLSDLSVTMRPHSPTLHRLTGVRRDPHRRVDVWQALSGIAVDESQASADERVEDFRRADFLRQAECLARVLLKKSYKCSGIHTIPHGLHCPWHGGS